MSASSENIRGIRYRVGIDVGLRSIGFCAVEVDQRDQPVRLLNSTVHLHDAGVEPGSEKTSLSRKKVAGVAHRSRRRARARRKRLDELDVYLSESLGWPLPCLDNYEDPHEPWHVRSELLGAYVSDPVERKELLSIATRHIARHRGWRNSYTSVSALAKRSYPSNLLTGVNGRVSRACGRDLPPEFTQGQLVSFYLSDDRYVLSAVRGALGILGGKLHQSDSYFELKLILQKQKVDQEIIKKLMNIVFKVTHPRDGAKKHVHVGYDKLPGQEQLRRAEVAHPAFQKFRIVSFLANLRISTSDGDRGLTAEELEKLTQFIMEKAIKLEDVGWVDLAHELDITRSQLKGTAKAAFDGEAVLRYPPTDTTTRIVMRTKLPKLKKWWKGADDRERGHLVDFLSSTRGSEQVFCENDAIEEFVSGLSEDELTKLEEISLPSGRAAYCLDSLYRLTERMLAEGVDLHEARKQEFSVTDDWSPQTDPIYAPVGNPAVDRVLKQVNRWLVMATKRWGVPESVNIEHTRSGLSSAKHAEDIVKANKRRHSNNERVFRELAERLGIGGKLYQSVRIKCLALNRQNCTCLYCGVPISFESAEIDHILPRSGVGSTNDKSNLVAVCRTCNHSKGKRPFAVWVDSGAASGSVSLDSVIERVRSWDKDAGSSGKEHRKFQAAVIARLNSRMPDQEFDGRSMESVAWMAVELGKRIKGFYARTLSVKEGYTVPSVGLYRGRITAAARVVSGFEGRVHLIGGNGKTRFDRRHHAMDALVIALLTEPIARLLAIRDNLLFAQRLNDGPDEWAKYLCANPSAHARMCAWADVMSVASELFNGALEADKVKFTRNLRLRRTSSAVHKESVYSFAHAYKDRDQNRVPKLDSKGRRKIKEHGECHLLSDRLPVDLIDRAATPALWTALVRAQGYDPVEGLPADPGRRITVNGRRVGPNDELNFFGISNSGMWSAAIAVRGGYASISSTIHHVRLYRLSGKGATYGIVRVFQVDLRHAGASDLFSFPLPPSSISMRTADKSVRSALVEGRATKLGWLVAGDELRVVPSNYPKNKIGKFFAECPYASSWTVVGFESSTKLNLRPVLVSEEGFDQDTPPAVREIAAGEKSWRVSVSALLSPGGVVVIRRNVLGEERWKSLSGLPISTVLE